MVRNTRVPVPGETAIFCAVPEYDYDRDLETEVVVAAVNGNEVVLADGSRTAVAYVWENRLAIERALYDAAEFAAIDDAMLRAAI